MASDEADASIIGDTAGGVTYGVTWEAWESLEDAGDVRKEQLSDDDRQTPFSGHASVATLSAQ